MIYYKVVNVTSDPKTFTSYLKSQLSLDYRVGQVTEANPQAVAAGYGLFVFKSMLAVDRFLADEAVNPCFELEGPKVVVLECTADKPMSLPPYRWFRPVLDKLGLVPPDYQGRLSNWPYSTAMVPWVKVLSAQPWEDL